MRVLSRSEVDGFVNEGRKLSEQAGTSILDEFERRQPPMYQAIFGELSDGVADVNTDMADLFLDLCFDIIFVYRTAFGTTPGKRRSKKWLEEKVALLDAELKALNTEDQMSRKFRQRLSSRFVERSVASGIQLELLGHLDEQVRRYASFQPSRKEAIHVTNNLLFVVVRLMDDIYSAA